MCVVLGAVNLWRKESHRLILVSLLADKQRVWAGNGFVDYVLWGDDGKPLAVVEAKPTRRNAKVAQQQAKLCVDCLQAQCGQRSMIFYSNGYETFMAAMKNSV